METIKVNMSPNPLDVQTIHASQNDSEARQWEFELHNNGELIDTSGITEQLFFKSYKGGTEQILPENTSTPTTSPFIGDIRYPQGLLTNQEFTYRQSPTESDGLAKITDIKGNTLVWNQLVQNGNFADGTNGWRKTNQTDSFSVSNNILSFHTNYVYGSVFNTLPIDVNNHVLLIKAQVRTQGNSGIVRAKLTNNFGYINNDFSFTIDQVNVWTDVLMYGTYATTPQGSTETPKIGFQDYRNISSSNLIEVKNVQVFDLTQMGYDSIVDPSEFISLFPLSYYSYNQGSLLSFNGNGIKTVGKNLLPKNRTNDISVVNGITFEVQDGVYYIHGTATDTASYSIPLSQSVDLAPSKNKIAFFNDNTSSTNVVFRRDTTVVHYWAMAVQNRVASGWAGSGNELVDNIALTVQAGVTVDLHVSPMLLRLNVSADTFEPYTSSTLSLPISTYFPNGMKSAGNVYDELTPTKAITRIGAVDLGTLTFSQSSNFYYRQNSQDLGMKADTLVFFNAVDSNITSIYYYSNSGQFRVYVNDVSIVPSGMLYYELATPTETSFTTASLVTENAEIHLSNEDGVLIGKCTEQLSENPGFIDAKIKLSDADGECYSNKIQLHIERSPQ